MEVDDDASPPPPVLPACNRRPAVPVGRKGGGGCGCWLVGERGGWGRWVEPWTSPSNSGHHIGVVDVTIPTIFDDDMLYAPSQDVLVVQGPGVGRWATLPSGTRRAPRYRKARTLRFTYTCAMVASTTTTTNYMYG